MKEWEMDTGWETGAQQSRSVNVDRSIGSTGKWNI